jgi:hypothetical protein
MTVPENERRWKAVCQWYSRHVTEIYDMSRLSSRQNKPKDARRGKTLTVRLDEHSSKFEELRQLQGNVAARSLTKSASDQQEPYAACRMPSRRLNERA